ncbi:MAG: hypothetical protein M3N54_10095 [Acidobacteriota bacterium]|nr:hypothetical protein [Acidobacteriota bacterium]
MKTLANRIAQLTAGVIVLGGMAYGQNVMKADIPFAFRASNTTLPAGSYTLIEQTGSGVVNVRLWNGATRRSVLTTSGPLDTHSGGKPSVTFLCTGDKCSLSRIRSGVGTVAYAAPHKSRQEKQVAAEVSIPMAAVRGD